ncbi:hypothetical protein [Sulfitobacter sp. EE-36]|uniref:Rz1-like lysis system protein LysC n=1 Tax=Sulfitobacter TaxID=60136 RepID=UPI00032561C3|nr:hypothetical protein [Sulfitobacter sp. EE-36]
MRRLILIFPVLLMGCFGKTEYVQLRDEIPAELLEPTPISTRRPATYRELAILATEHLNSARQANADKAAITEILGARLQ